MLLLLIICHLIGDYVLQTDYIAKTKGDNIYHLQVHCVLYIVPFLLVFGVSWQLSVIHISHIIIDLLKAKYNKLTYPQDQILHYLVLLVYFIGR